LLRNQLAAKQESLKRIKVGVFILTMLNIFNGLFHLLDVDKTIHHVLRAISKYIMTE
jgi:hypothetical protein